MIKHINFINKNGVRKSIATVFKGKNENNHPIVYPRRLEMTDYTSYWLTINAQYGQVCIRTGYRLNHEW